MTNPNPPGYPPTGGQPPQGGQPHLPPQGGQPALPPQGGQTGPPARPPAPEKYSVSVGQILGGILFVLLIIFIVENSHNVAIRIIAGPEVHPPVWVVIVIAAALGALISELLRYRRRAAARRKRLAREYEAGQLGPQPGASGRGRKGGRR